MELPENLNHLFALQNSLEAGNTGVMFRSVLILEEYAMTILCLLKHCACLLASSPCLRTSSCAGALYEDSLIFDSVLMTYVDLAGAL